MERITGIEPALSAWEAEVLPLNYIRNFKLQQDNITTHSLTEHVVIMSLMLS